MIENGIMQIELFPWLNFFPGNKRKTLSQTANESIVI